MPGYGYGYGFGVTPPAGGGAAGPPIANLYTWVNVENAVSYEEVGVDYVDYYVTDTGDYTGDWVHAGAGAEAHKYDGTSTKNGISIPRIWKPTGGKCPYDDETTDQDWNAATFIWCWKHPVGQNNPMYLAGQGATYWWDSVYKSQTRKMGWRLDGNFYDVTNINTLDYDVWQIGVWWFDRNQSPTFKCYLDTADVTHVAHNLIDKSFTYGTMWNTEDSTGNQCWVGDALMYNAALGVEDINAAANFLSAKFDLGQTWELA